MVTFSPMNRYAAQRDVRAVRPGTAGLVSDRLWVTYRWMSLGLGLTGVVAWLVSSSPEAIDLIFGNRMVFWGLLIAQLAIVWTFSSVAQRAGTALTAAMFFLYAAITGLTMSVIFLIYTGSSIFLTFAVCAGGFAGLSLFGAVTRRDLSGVGRFAIFALFGLIIASLVNIFLGSALLTWLTTFAGVLIFGALTAYDTNKLRNLFESEGGGGRNLPLYGALVLYLDFINLFLFLLRIFGRSRDN